MLIIVHLHNASNAWIIFHIKSYAQKQSIFTLLIFGSLSVGHYKLCRDDIGDLLGSPNHLWLRENANEIG